MSEESILTTTDKIDYIFAYIRKEEKRQRNKLIVKWIFRLLIIWYIFYVYFILWPLAKGFYEKIFNNPLINQTEVTQSTNEKSWWWEIQIWSLKINSEKASQIRALFCK